MVRNQPQTDERRTEQQNRGYRNAGELKRSLEDRDWNITQVGRDYGVTRTTIRQWMNRHDIEKPEPRRFSNQNVADGCPWHDPDTLEDVFDRVDGNVGAVAEEFDIHEETARRVLSKYGVRETKKTGDQLLDELNPEDVGLSPLRENTEQGVMTDGGRNEGVE